MTLRKHIVLLGMMGSGKSTLAPLLAQRFGAGARELDDDIVAAAGQSIPAIFAQAGEQQFREFETAALRAALAGPACVIAAGGGVPAQDRNRKLLEQADCLCVHLSAPADVLTERVGADAGRERPMLAGASAAERIGQLLAERDASYRAAADYAVDVGSGEGPQETCARIADLISDDACA